MNCIASEADKHSYTQAQHSLWRDPSYSTSGVPSTLWTLQQISCTMLLWLCVLCSMLDVRYMISGSIVNLLKWQSIRSCYFSYLALLSELESFYMLTFWLCCCIVKFKILVNPCVWMLYLKCTVVTCIIVTCCAILFEWISGNFRQTLVL